MDFSKVVYREPHLVHPLMQAQVRELVDRCDLQVLFHPQTKDPYQFVLFETYRTPQRQFDLRWGKKRVTKADMWQSAHQYGLAVDFCGYIETEDPSKNLFSWDDNLDWGWLKQQAESVGLLVPIKWDRGHVEHPKWAQLAADLRPVHKTINGTKAKVEKDA